MKADKNKVTRLLTKQRKGQIDGILRMIDEDRYCIDISNQLMAADAILRKANKEILSADMKCCVSEAMKSDNADKKIEELVGLIDKL